MERREFARVAVELPLSLSGNGMAGGGLISGLSARGCTLVSDELILPGTTLALRIQLPTQSVPLKVDLAEVRWAQGRECGLEFLRLRLEEKKRLRRFLSALQRAQGGGFQQTG
ncbi:MAG: PilZ domain-containing protein [Nitrospirae bacterium]|nr:PilZ domain-containing protein [Nitrospirota bacterium]